MPRQRFIWPDLWANPTFGRLSELEKVLYIGLFSMADDEGRLRAEPAFLAATILPNAKIGTTRVRRARNAIAAAFDHVVLYEQEGAEYIALLNWSNWQKPKYPSPSRLPPPPGHSGNDSGTLSGNDSGNHSGNDSPTGRDGLRRVKPPLPPLPGGNDALTRSTPSPRPPRQRRTEPAAPKPADTFTICQRNIEGLGWDEATPWEAILEDIERAEKKHGPLTADQHRELHALWETERAIRYPTEITA